MICTRDQLNQLNYQTVTMSDNINIAELYYEAMNNKDLNEIALYLHPKVKFLGPLAQLEGKEAVLESAKGFLGIVDSVRDASKIRFWQSGYASL